MSDTWVMTIEQGADFSESFSWTRADGTPMPMAGASAVMHVVDTAGNVVATFSTSPTSGQGTITLGASDGSIALYMSGANTALLAKGVGYKRAMDVTFSDSTVKRRLVGFCNIVGAQDQ